MYWDINNVKTNDDLNRYGWEMKLLQIDDVIALLKKERMDCQMRLNSIVEKELDVEE